MPDLCLCHGALGSAPEVRHVAQRAFRILFRILFGVMSTLAIAKRRAPQADFKSLYQGPPSSPVRRVRS